MQIVLQFVEHASQKYSDFHLDPYDSGISSGVNLRPNYS